MLLRTVVVLGMLAAVLAPAAAQSPQPSIEGKFRGGYVCGKLPTTRGILQAPLDVIISGGHVEFARPLFNPDGTVVVGTELGAGDIDANGRLHLTSAWSYLGFKARGEYGGMLTPSGGTLTGSQVWTNADGSDPLTRDCAAALVRVSNLATP